MKRQQILLQRGTVAAPVTTEIEPPAAAELRRHPA